MMGSSLVQTKNLWPAQWETDKLIYEFIAPGDCQGKLNNTEDAENRVPSIDRTMTRKLTTAKKQFICERFPFGSSSFIDDFGYIVGANMCDGCVTWFRIEANLELHAQSETER